MINDEFKGAANCPDLFIIEKGLDILAQLGSNILKIAYDVLRRN